MKSLTEIQAGVQFSGAERGLSLTTDENLPVFNRNYRGLAAELPWPELRRRDTSIATTAGTAPYDMPLRNSIVFLDLKIVEIQDGDDEDKYKKISPAPSELAFSLAAVEPNAGVPKYYILDNDGDVDQIRFAPSPKYAKTVRLTGIVEPEPLVDGDGVTAFRQRAADDALEHIVAADLFSQAGISGGARSAAQLVKAQQILGRLFGIDAVPLDKLQRIAGG